MSKPTLAALAVLLVLPTVLSLTLLAHPVLAHVLITDDSGSVGAVLHVAPDDDPIAGEPSSLVYEIEDQSFGQSIHHLTLQITDGNGKVADVPLTAQDGTVAARYTFPAQGVYRLSLIAQAGSTSASHVHTFTYTQRVSRGRVAGPADIPGHAWADIVLVAASSALLLLVVTAVGRHQAIAAHSNW